MSELKERMLGQTMNQYGCDTKIYLKSEVDEVIAELEESHKKEVEQLLIEIVKLKDKCQMHDFFWEGCGFAKLGFKNAIAVSEAFDRLEAENAELKDENDSLLQQNHEICEALSVMYSREEYNQLKAENERLKAQIEEIEHDLHRMRSRYECEG